MSIQDVTAVIDAKAIKRYCDSRHANHCVGCVFNKQDGERTMNSDCLLFNFLGFNGEAVRQEAKQRIDERLIALSK